ncbi:MAG TPA: carboxymuconolactone decarboxylase family protein, partial [Blastocatellia bacterium]|nr:carboxymuconolactone decarboxylase family protein [Blastocatellia bacterium]
ITPNMMKTMAQSPAVLEAYLNFSGALGGGKLNARLREQIALISAEVNGCGYCASAHTTIGKMVGLDEDAILAARNGNAADAKTKATGSPNLFKTFWRNKKTVKKKEVRKWPTDFMN